jgi:hypothetical protein
MNILIGQNRVATEALDIGYDANGNRRRVVHWLRIYNEIAARTGMDHDALSDRPYDIALDAMRSIGGKRYHNRKYGGGIVFTLDRSELESSINEAIDAYSRWYNSENVSASIVEQIERRMRHRLSIVVKSTNSGYVVSGEYSNGLALKIKCAHDHNLSLVAAPLQAALLWVAKAELKRWQLNGQDSNIKLLSDYTALDANTRVYQYEIQGA